MNSPQKQIKHQIPTLDFVPAELKKGSKGNWMIQYYITDPTSDKPTLKRKQKRVKPMQNSRERERYAKRIIFEINRKLDRGWNPILEMEAPKSLDRIKDVSDKFLRNTEKQVKDGSLREDTLRSYKSFLNNFNKYLSDRGEADMFCLNFNRILIGDFLDHIYYDRNNSPRTYNNYLGFFVSFSKYMLQKGHIKANPAEAFPRKPKANKKRTVIEDQDLKHIFEILQREDPAFYVVSFLMYHGLIRRTEMSKILISDIKLKERYILIRPEVAKTSTKDQTVTISKELLPVLVDHINGFNNSDYLFSKNGFKPGPEKQTPKAFSDRWGKYKKDYSWKDTYHFYSLKDTGITNLLRAGVPAIHVRDHARHTDIQMTQKYTPFNSGVAPEILDGMLKM